jgi:hypothetical protein
VLRSRVKFSILSLNWRIILRSKIACRAVLPKRFPAVPVIGAFGDHAELQHQTIFQLTALFGIDIQRPEEQ